MTPDRVRMSQDEHPFSLGRHPRHSPRGIRFFAEVCEWYWNASCLCESMVQIFLSCVEFLFCPCNWNDKRILVQTVWDRQLCGWASDMWIQLVFANKLWHQTGTACLFDFILVLRWVFEKWAVWRIWVILSFRLYPFMVFECLSVGLGKLSRKLSDLDPFLASPQLILLSHSEYVAGWTSNSTTVGGSGPSALFAVPGQGKKRSGPPAKPWLRRERTVFRMKQHGGFKASCFLKQLGMSENGGYPQL